MKFTLSWLKEFLDTDATLVEITAKLTAIGLEVEKVQDRAKEFAPFKVAQIIKAEPHPNADRLRICQVDSGNEKLQIVCGAPNARDGIKVVLAPVGSIIPTNNMEIKSAEIRGIKSSGMLCSARELGLGEDSAGIMELPEDAKIGSAFAKLMELDDPVIEIAITPNRGDCLGVYGIARDLAASGMGKLKKLTAPKIKSKFESPIKVTIKNKKKAPMFIGRYIRGVKNSESPQWLENRLKAIGLRPISAFVDITNYLTFTFGRPAHVYDAATLQGNITIRDAEVGERIKALDDKEYSLEKGMVVIADENAPVAIGGIIGGEVTGCTDKTTDVFLEIALFSPINIAETGRKLQINSDARYRFERSVDHGFIKMGAELATQMILDICGGETSELVIAGEEPKEKTKIKLPVDKVKEIVGIAPTKKEIVLILQNLGFDISSKGNNLSVQVPSWRSDITIAEDVVEEIARIYGYDRIPALNMPSADTEFKGVLNTRQKQSFDIRRLLASRGMEEVVTFSFCNSAHLKVFGKDSEKLKLANPISADLDAMRPTILPNLLIVLGKNQARGYSDLAIFEVGPVFSSAEPGKQEIVSSAIRAGAAVPRNPNIACRDIDVFDVKADAMAALSLVVSPSSLQISTEVPLYYHPGKAGAFVLGKEVVGYFGELHPNVIKTMDVKGPVAAFEIFVSRLPEGKDKKSSARPKLELSNFQAVERDFAFIIDENIASVELVKAARKTDKNLITEASVFDLYAGKGIETGKKSIAIAIRLEPKDHTLTDEEIEKVSDLVVENIEKATGGILRK